MNLIAIDTCTEVCSVSLYTNRQKISRFIQGKAKSSSLILPLCDEVFAESNLSVTNLDGIIYTKGPGAFTGVRMCVGVVQGMALAHDIPTIGFSTLEVMGYGAMQKFKSNKIAIALDARMNEIYWGVYQNGQLTQEALKKPNEVEALNNDFIGVGTGWGAYQQTLVDKTGIKKFKSNFYPKAENLIDLYLTQKNDFDNKLPLPIYLRNNVAQKPIKKR